MTAPRCEDHRAALSAHVDGEDAPLSIEVVDAHVANCADCTAFAAGLPLIQERVATFRAAPVEDRTAEVLATAAAQQRTAGPTPEQLRGLLGLAALVQVVIGIAALATGGDHVARDLAFFELAVGSGLAAAAWRPQYATGLLPMIGVAAVLGVVAVVSDVVMGTTSLATEFAHLVLVVATWPLAALARRHGPVGTVAAR